MIVLVSFLVGSFKLEGKNSYVQPRLDDSTHIRSFFITTNLSDYFPDWLYTGVFNLGVETKMSELYSIDLNLGYVRSYRPILTPIFLLPFPTGKSPFIGSIDTKGFKTGLELKRFFSINSESIYQKERRTYFSLLSVYQRTKTRRPGTAYEYGSFTDENGVVYIFPTTKKIIIYDTYRNLGFFSVKIGRQFISSSNFIIDCGIGGGVQYVSSYSVNRPEIEDMLPNNQDDFILFNSEIEDVWPNNQDDSFLFNSMHKHFDSGSAFFPKLLFQLKIGWKYDYKK